MSQTTPPEVPRYQVGTSLWLGVEVLDLAGAAYPLTNVSVTAIVRAENGRAKASLLVEWVDRAQGRFELWAPGDGTCTGWDPGDYQITVQYRETGAGTNGRDLVVGTESFVIKVEA